MVEYLYIDTSGNTGSIDRTVNVVDSDSTAPVVTLSGSYTVSGEIGIAYIDDSASWTDNVDGSGETLTGSYGSIGSFSLSGIVDSNTLGIYYLQYQKVDTSGNSANATRTVNIVDTTAPFVYLSGSSPVTVVR